MVFQQMIEETRRGGHGFNRQGAYCRAALWTLSGVSAGVAASSFRGLPLGLAETLPLPTRPTP
jgi:hypothetical protein